MSELAHRIELTAKDQKIADLEQKVAGLEKWEKWGKEIIETTHLFADAPEYIKLYKLKEEQIKAVEAQCSKMRVALENLVKHSMYKRSGILVNQSLNHQIKLQEGFDNAWDEAKRALSYGGN